MGRDTIDAKVKHYPLSFNPRARVGRDLRSASTLSLSLCFDPRARVGRDVCLATRDLFRGVSIRAPAWGATVRRDTSYLPCLVSIRAPAWGATISARLGGRCAGRFNPRARVGRDHRCAGAHCQGGHVSIRAPAWGATWVDLANILQVAFQSARPRGARQT